MCLIYAKVRIEFTIIISSWCSGVLYLIVTVCSFIIELDITTIFRVYQGLAPILALCKDNKDSLQHLGGFYLSISYKAAQTKSDDNSKTAFHLIKRHTRLHQINLVLKLSAFGSYKGLPRISL